MLECLLIFKKVSDIISLWETTLVCLVQMTAISNEKEINDMRILFCILVMHI